MGCLLVVSRQELLDDCGSGCVRHYLGNGNACCVKRHIQRDRHTSLIDWSCRYPRYPRYPYPTPATPATPEVSCAMNPARWYVQPHSYSRSAVPKVRVLILLFPISSSTIDSRIALLDKVT